MYTVQALPYFNCFFSLSLGGGINRKKKIMIVVTICGKGVGFNRIRLISAPFSTCKVIHCDYSFPYVFNMFKIKPHFKCSI